MDKRSYRLEGVVTLLTPLSHIGETVGPDAYLSTEVIIGPDGLPTECFAYSGNAFRGQLRDLGAQYLLDHIDRRVSLDLFHLLFGGGSLGGDQSIDIDRARMIRQAVPLMSVFGGGVGSQILGGKLRIGPMWPLCAETQRLIPPRLRDPEAPSWRQWTYDHSYTRRDDSKDCILTERYLAGDEPVALLTAGKGKEDTKPQQMRYTVEMLAAGARLWHQIDLIDVTQVELGAFVSCLARFAERPYIGGMSRLGAGRVDIEYTIDGEPFMLVGDTLRLERPAEAAKQAYDEHLATYRAYLDERREEVLLALGDGSGRAAR